MAATKAGLPILAFASLAAWERWLAAQPPGAAGVWLKIAKKAAGVASFTRDEAVDAALCHGWIDGQGAPFDGGAWLVRFTPRKARSRWSLKNRERIADLTAAGRMQAAGVAEVERAKADGRWAAAYAPPSRAEVPEDLARALAASKPAAAFFAALSGANRFAILYRVAEAKKPETRAARIAKFVAMLERGETIYPQKRRP
ncbi:MAG: YdeI/OmpD-associated family protein [Bauldia sp.]